MSETRTDVRSLVEQIAESYPDLLFSDGEPSLQQVLTRLCEREKSPRLPTKLGLKACLYLEKAITRWTVALEPIMGRYKRNQATKPSERLVAAFLAVPDGNSYLQPYLLLNHSDMLKTIRSFLEGQTLSILPAGAKTHQVDLLNGFNNVYFRAFAERFPDIAADVESRDKPTLDHLEINPVTILRDYERQLEVEGMFARARIQTLFRKPLPHVPLRQLFSDADDARADPVGNHYDNAFWVQRIIWGEAESSWFGSPFEGWGKKAADLVITDLQRPLGDDKKLTSRQIRASEMTGQEGNFLVVTYDEVKSVLLYTGHKDIGPDFCPGEFHIRPRQRAFIYGFALPEDSALAQTSAECQCSCAQKRALPNDEMRAAEATPTKIMRTNQGAVPRSRDGRDRKDDRARPTIITRSDEWLQALKQPMYEPKNIRITRALLGRIWLKDDPDATEILEILRINPTRIPYSAPRRAIEGELGLPEPKLQAVAMKEGRCYSCQQLLGRDRHQCVQQKDHQASKQTIQTEIGNQVFFERLNQARIETLVAALKDFR